MRSPHNGQRIALNDLLLLMEQANQRCQAATEDNRHGEQHPTTRKTPAGLTRNLRPTFLYLTLNVGVVAEGSTAKLAHIVAESTGAPMVRIVPDQPYPTGYDDAKQIIQHELETQARPAIRLEALASEPFDAEQAIAAADRIALGYPIWCGSLPMPVRTFLDEHDLGGKTILPFCTNEGSGLARTMDELRDALLDSDIRPGLPVLGSTVQHDPADARAAVAVWLDDHSSR